MKENMKKTYQTPVVTAIDIAVESQILAGSSGSLGFGRDSIEDPSLADAPGRIYIMDDEEEEDEYEDYGSYWK